MYSLSLSLTYEGSRLMSLLSSSWSSYSSLGGFWSEMTLGITGSGISSGTTGSGTTTTSASIRSILIIGLDPTLSYVRKLTWIWTVESIRSKSLDWIETEYPHMLFVVVKAEVDAMELASPSSWVTPSPSSDKPSAEKNFDSIARMAGFLHVFENVPVVLYTSTSKEMFMISLLFSYTV